MTILDLIYSFPGYMIIGMIFAGIILATLESRNKLKYPGSIAIMSILAWPLVVSFIIAYDFIEWFKNYTKGSKNEGS